MEMTVSLKENSYPIYIEKGILNQADCLLYTSDAADE